MVSARAGIMSSPRGRGVGLLALAAAPFVVGRLAAPRNPGGIGGVAIPCPFRATTGLPCPLCGSTRAVALAAHGDGDFTEYNAAIVVMLALVALYAVVRIAVPGMRSLARVERGFRDHPVRWVGTVLAVAWVWTLTHREAIVS